MNKIIIQKRLLFDVDIFPTVFNRLTNLYIEFIYFNLLKQNPNIRYIKIKIYFYNEEGKKFKEMFFFKERPNKISLKVFHHNLIFEFSQWIKNKKFEKFYEYDLIISYVI